MSASKIKKLIDNFDYAQQDEGWNDCKAAEAMQSGANRDVVEEYENARDMASDDMFYIRDEIIKLNPSKYMIKKYPLLEDIIEDRF